MANLRIFSARDAKLGIFIQPFFNAHLGQALRMWEDAVNSPDTLVAKHPSDFVLYELGTFDDDTGLVTAHNPIQMVSTAMDVLKRPQDSLPFNQIKNANI